MSQEENKEQFPPIPDLDTDDPTQFFEHFQGLLKQYQNKQNEIYNEKETARKQRFYDQDLMDAFMSDCLDMESWLLYSEALAILQGWEPSQNRTAGYCASDWAKEMKKLAEESQHTSLPLLNPTDKPTEWRVDPTAIVKWLWRKNLYPVNAVNESLQRIIGDISKSDLNESDKQKRNTTHHAQKREEILQASLAVLAEFPERCRTNGKVSASAIAQVLEEKSPILFESGDVPLSPERTVKVIRQALKKAK